MTDTADHRLSIFDLDRTLTKRGTWSPFLLFAASRLAPWRLALTPVVVLLMAGYKARLMSRRQLKQSMQALMLGRRLRRDVVHDLAARYADHCLAHNLHAEALVRIAAERAAGRRIVIASAAHAFYLQAIADRLGIADEVGTLSRWHGRWLTAAIDGQNCYGAEKRRRLERWLAGQGLARADAHVRFFSDDLSDLPTFDWADEAVAVNPSRKLLRCAVKRGWTVLDWRRRPAPQTPRQAASALSAG